MKIGITMAVREGQSIWENGIGQNCLFLWQTLNQLYPTWIVVPSDVQPSFPKISPSWRSLSQSSDLDVIIEMGFGLPDEFVRGFAGQVVLYAVGNDYVVDCERIAYGLPNSWLVPQTPRAAVLVLRQYVGNIPYYERTVKAKAIVAPHVWAPTFVQQTPVLSNRRRIAIVEPGVSRSKTSVVPMVLAERVYREDPKAIEAVTVFTSFRNQLELFASSLLITQHGVLQFSGRQAMPDILGQHGLILSHQDQNAQNYVYYEALHLGVALVHNSPVIKDLGHYYQGFDHRPLESALAGQIGSTGSPWDGVSDPATLSWFKRFLESL